MGARALLLQTTAVSVWTVETFVLGLRVGVPWAAVLALALAAGSAWLTACWGRLAEWAGPVLVVIEIGVLFLCAFAALVHGLTLGSSVFGALSAVVLVLLALPRSRARSADLGRG